MDENSYSEIPKFIMTFLKDETMREKLSDKLLREIGLAAEDIMREMRKIVKNDIQNWRDPITEMIMSENHNFELVGARFTSAFVVFENINAYHKLKESFLKLPDGDDAKPFYAAAIFFFSAYYSDQKFHTILKEYYERTIDKQMPLLIRNYGRIDVARQALLTSLTDSQKKDKHWVYQLFLDHLPTNNNEIL